MLTLSAAALGVGLAFLAWPTPLYNTVPNAATIAFLGIFNGLLSMGCWQLGKYLPNISKLVTGKARLTLSPPPPAEKPKDDEKDEKDEKEEEKPEAGDDDPEVEEEKPKEGDKPEDDKPKED